MRINQNISAMNTYSRLTSANTAKSGSLAKLSSGLRINKAGDDAAGLAISEKMRGQVSGLNQAAKNAQDGISLIQTAEGALSETHSILQRMRELSVQSANDTNTSDDRKEIQKEITELTTEIGRIAKDTQFNTKVLMNGDFSQGLTGTISNATQVSSVEYKSGTLKNSDTVAVTQTVTHGAESGTGNADGAFASMAVSVAGTSVAFTATEIAEGTLSKDVTDGDGNIFTVTIKDAVATTLGNGAGTTTTADSLTYEDKGLKFHIGANDGQNITLGLNDMSEVGLSLSSLNVSTQQGADAAIATIDDAISTVSAERSKLGATQNRLDHTINNLTATSENLSAAESRIRDVDMAQEMMEFTKNNILSQAATSMLAQANQMPQSVLQLLQ